jgi:hypothetical protein
MSQMMNAIEIGIWNALMPIRRRKARTQSNEAPPRFAPDEVRLAFLTKAANEPAQAEPVHSLLRKFSPLEEQSLQPTVRVSVGTNKISVFEGATVATKVVVDAIKKSQAFMVVSSSFLGLLIGVLIAFFLK